MLPKQHSKCILSKQCFGNNLGTVKMKSNSTHTLLTPLCHKTTDGSEHESITRAGYWTENGAQMCSPLKMQNGVPLLACLRVPTRSIDFTL